MELHREVVRPWGSYDCIDQGKNFQVKRIIVKPHEKLSLQKHQHRDEHWVVVSGIAKVTNGEETFLLSENESTFIPAGVIHSLENPEDKLVGFLVGQVMKSSESKVNPGSVKEVLLKELFG